jgi:hypothetical protein
LLGVLGLLPESQASRHQSFPPSVAIPLGIDEQGREVLTSIPGQDGRHALQGLPALAAVGQLIRRFHDAVAGFRPPPDSVWQSACPPEPLGGPPK